MRPRCAGCLSRSHGCCAAPRRLLPKTAAAHARRAADETAGAEAAEPAGPAWTQRQGRRSRAGDSATKDDPLAPQAQHCAIVRRSKPFGSLLFTAMGQRQQIDSAQRNRGVSPRCILPLGCWPRAHDRVRSNYHFFQKPRLFAHNQRQSANTSTGRPSDAPPCRPSACRWTRFARSCGKRARSWTPGHTAWRRT